MFDNILVIFELYLIFNNLVGNYQTREGTYIETEQNKDHLAKQLKLRETVLREAEPMEENVGHNTKFN